MRHRLGPIDHHYGAALMGEADDLRDRVHRAEHVRDVDHRHDPRAIGQQRRVGVEIQFSGVGHRDDPQPRAGLLAEGLPRHDVRVVLHRRDDDLVAPADLRSPVRGGDEVDRLGRAADKDDLLWKARVQEPRDGGARRLVRVGRALAQP